MEKIGNLSIYALWDCFNQGFLVKLTKEDVEEKGQRVNLGALVHTMDTFKRGFLPSTELLTAYFKPARRKIETPPEAFIHKRSLPANTGGDGDNREISRQQEQQRHHEKYERKEYTIKLPNDVKILVEKCLGLNNKGAKPLFTTEWIQDHFGKKKSWN